MITKKYLSIILITLLVAILAIVLSPANLSVTDKVELSLLVAFPAVICIWATLPCPGNKEYAQKAMCFLIGISLLTFMISITGYGLILTCGIPVSLAGLYTYLAITDKALFVL